MFKLYEALNTAHAKSLSRSGWQLDAGARLVKAVPVFGGYWTRLNRPSAAVRIGYVTQERYLVGKNPDGLERAFGLPPFELKSGALILALTKLPTDEQFEFKGFADYPGGTHFDTQQMEKYLRERADIVNRFTQKVYPPGDAALPQWDVSADTQTIPCELVCRLYPGQEYRPGNYQSR